ncbi:MAG TPA: hypothetical protein DCL54_11930 [Alphaproteobacteria bacterium]|nr:hypothetical protein [Alphaproteobacteria bacterium]HAJ47276.1 hypothetical protein [Alphaproteobacteria bacterium]
MAVLLLAACSEPQAPPGRWEGFSVSPDWVIAVRLEMAKGNVMRASALSAALTGEDLPRKVALENEVRTAMRAQWLAVPKGQIEFKGNTVTRTNGFAPVFVYEPASRAMVFHFYAGGKLTEKVTLRPVDSFAR